MPKKPPIKHHIDKRADQVIDLGAGDDNELLTTEQLCAWLGYSRAWAEGARGSEEEGPRFIRMSPRRIRYRRGDVRDWLKSRTHKSTSEYTA